MFVAERLDFEIDVELETGLITGHAGVPGLIEAFRQTGTAAVIDREIRLKPPQARSATSSPKPVRSFAPSPIPGATPPQITAS
jgi:hypothetical protein